MAGVQTLVHAGAFGKSCSQDTFYAFFVREDPVSAIISFLYDPQLPQGLQKKEPRISVSQNCYFAQTL